MAAAGRLKRMRRRSRRVEAEVVVVVLGVVLVLVLVAVVVLGVAVVLVLGGVVVVVVDVVLGMECVSGEDWDAAEGVPDDGAVEAEVVEVVREVVSTRMGLRGVITIGVDKTVTVLC